MANHSRWGDIKRIVEKALDLPEEERERYLDGACDADVELRRAVEELLAVSETQARAIDNLRVLPESVQPVEFAEGELVGSHRIIRRLGAGGMGAVYLATDERTDRKVALKILSTRTQFNRGEHKLHAKLTHPFIATLYESGKTAGDLPYLAIEYIDGLPLAKYCEEHQPSLRQRLVLFKRICEGVQYAHQKFVVHGDLTLNNILVTANGEPKILDFGIAKEIQGDPAAETVGALNPLTLPFASPEQRLGQPIGPASDIYTLGILLCILLTGRYPYTFASLLDPSRQPQEVPLPSNLLEAAQPSSLPPPLGSPAHLKKSLRGDLDSIIQRALQPDPASRYQTAAELAQDVSNYLAIKPVNARPASRRYRTVKLLRRRALPFSLGTLFVIFVVVMSALLIGQYRRAVREERHASAQAERTRAVNRFVVDLLRRTNPSDQSGSPNSSVEELLDESARAAESSLQAHPDLRASLLSVLGEIFGARGDARRGRALLERALTLQRRGPSDLALAETLQRYGVVLTSEGRYRESDAALAEAKKVLAEIEDGMDPVLNARILMSQAANKINQDDYVAVRRLSQAAIDSLRHSPDSFLEIATALHGLGRILDIRDRNEEAEVLLNQALIYAGKLPDPRNPHYAAILHSLGVLRHERGDYAGAEKLYRQALEIKRVTLGEDSSTYAVTLHNLAALASAQGRHQEALQLFTQGLAILEKRLPPKHIRIMATRGQLAATLVQLQQYERAEKMFLGILADQRETLPRVHSDLATTLNNLANVYQNQGRFSEARRHYLEAAGIFTDLLGRNSRPVATLLGNLGGIAQVQGDIRAAGRHYTEALAIARGIDGGKNPETITSMVNLTSIYLSTGELEKARSLIGEATSLAESLVGPTSWRTGSTYLMEARVLLAQGDADGAILRAQQARTILTASLPPGDWKIAVAESVLGAALGRSGKIAEAERLLLHSHSELHRIRGDWALATREAMERVHSFYKSLGRDADAARYRTNGLRR